MVEKIDNALNESRILVLVVEVILGFQCQSFFQSGFHTLPRSSQYLKLGAIGLSLIALVLLISPTAYHRIVEPGCVSDSFLRFITRATMPALLPIALGLGVDFYVVGDKLINRPIGLLSGLLGCLVALFFWYGLEALAISQETPPPADETHMKSEPTALKDKIKFVLTEARVILPGAQALLGFQFAAVFTQNFNQLARSIIYVHFASLAAVALCTIFLMAPAAFHRIVERGEDTERLYTFASRMNLGALAFLALGIAGDVFVVVRKVLHSSPWAILLSGLTLLVFYGVWFGYMLYRRAEEPTSAKRPVPSSLS